MPDCCVMHCNFRKSVKGTFQSFKFPEDPAQRRLWVNAVKRERKSFILDNEKIICKRHFTPDDLVPVFDSRKRQGLLYSWTEHSADFFEKITTGGGKKAPQITPRG